MRLVHPVTVQVGTDPLPSELIFRGSDPWSVWLRIAPGEPDMVTWRLSRELLTLALTATPGALVGVPGADVVLFRDPEHIKLSLTGDSNAHAVLVFPLRDLRRFLSEVTSKYQLEDITVLTAVDELIAACRPPALPGDGR